MPQATVAALLDVARDLTAQERFDADVALKLLEHLQRADLDVQSPRRRHACAAGRYHGPG